MVYEYFKSRIILISLAVVYLVLLILVSIGFEVWLPSCPINKVFNIECFGCGLNRAAKALLQLDLKSAWSSNSLIFLYLPAITFLAGYDYLKFCRMFGQSKQQ